MSKPIVPAENLAESCIWAAKANRWLLQVVIPERQPAYRREAVYEDAKQVIYTAENAGKISHKCADRALWYLKDATGHLAI